MAITEDIVFNSEGQDEFRRLLHDKIYRHYGVADAEQLQAFPLHHLMQSLFRQSSFARLEPILQDYWYSAAYSPAENATGYTYKRPQKRYMPEEFQDDAWVDIVDILAEGHFNTGQSLNARRGNIRYGSVRYGTSHVFSAAREHLVALVDAIAARLPDKHLDGKLALPKTDTEIKAARAAALVQEKAAQIRHTGKPEEVYADADGNLKRAFCEGMGINPAEYEQPFAEMLRIALADAKVAVNMNPQAGCVFSRVTATGKGTGPQAECKALGGSPAKPVTLGRLMLERDALEDAGSDYFEISAQKRNKRIAAAAHSLNGVSVTTGPEYRAHNGIEHVRPLTERQARRIGEILKDYGISFYLQHLVLKAEIDYVKAGEAQCEHTRRMESAKPAAAPAANETPAEADVNVSEVLENAAGLRNVIYVALHRNVAETGAPSPEDAFIDYAAKHGWAHAEEQRAAAVTYDFRKERGGTPGLYAVVTCRDAAQAPEVRAALRRDYTVLSGDRQVAG